MEYVSAYKIVFFHLLQMKLRKWKLFIWKLRHNSLTTNANLFQRGWAITFPVKKVHFEKPHFPSYFGLKEIMVDPPLDLRPRNKRDCMAIFDHVCAPEGSRSVLYILCSCVEHCRL